MTATIDLGNRETRVELKTRVADGKPWRLVLVSQDPAIIQQASNYAGSVRAVSTVTYELAESVLEWFEQFMPWIPFSEELLQWRANLHVVKDTLERLSTAGKRYRMALDLPYADKLYNYQTIAVHWLLTARRGILADDPGLGKAQPLDAKVLTPTGWTTMGQLSIGSEIVDPDGGVANVESIFPQGENQVYQIEFTDGTSTECCLEHLWTVQTHADRRRGKFRTLSLRELLLNGLTRTEKNGNVRHTYHIPIAQATEYVSQAAGSIDAYLLGALIGNGHFSHSVLFSTNDPETLDRVKARLPKDVTAKYAGKYDYRITGESTNNSANSIQTSLRILGLADTRSNTKFIPAEYLRSSIHERKSLLAGLLDTDAECTTTGTVMYCTVSKQLAEDMRELVGSLGGFTTINSRYPTYTYDGDVKTGRLAYYINIRVPFNPFLLTRKASRWHAPYMTKSIRSVSATRRCLTQCIKVSSKRQLYVTDQWNVTHNTIQSLAAADATGARRILIVTVNETVQNQWADTLATWDLPGVVANVKGTADKRKKTFESEARWYILPASMLSKVVKGSALEKFLQSEWDVCIVDEAHMYQGHDSARTKNLMKVKAPYLFLLTGTPIWNRGDSLWSLLHILDRSRWSSRWQWLGKYFNIIESPFGRTIGHTRKEKYADLKQEIAEVMLRRTMIEIRADLPTAQMIEVPLAMPEELRVAYRAVKTAIYNFEPVHIGEKLVEITSRTQVLPISRSVLNNPSLLDLPVEADVKTARIVELATQLASTGQCLVFTWHTDYAERITALLNSAGISATSFHGKLSQETRAARLGEYKKGVFHVLVATLASIGVGVDLPQVAAAIFAETDWTPAIIEQAWRRIYRITSTTTKLIYFLYYTESVEELVYRVFNRKATFNEDLLTHAVFKGG